MILGRQPRTPLIGDTGVSKTGCRREPDAIGEADTVQGRVYCRNGGGTLSGRAGRELALPLMEYGRRWAWPG